MTRIILPLHNSSPTEDGVSALCHVFLTEELSSAC